MLAVAMALAGCAAPPARTGYGEIQALLATVPDMGAVRFPADAVSPWRKLVATAAAAAKARHARTAILALSGGGEDGAFGAGFLVGLDGSGRRPDYAIVTGVSSGALMAPFVFLGPAHDATLKSLFTDGYAAALGKDPSVVDALVGDSLISDDRLGDLVSRFVTRELLDAIAAEHRKGRRLVVVTTDLDSETSMAWDMGAIASDPAPRALDLFRDVLAASATVPALFRPRLIEVTDGRRSFKEMHVDGGVKRQLYAGPDGVVHGKGLAPGIDDVYLVLNNRIDPGLRVTTDTTFGVGGRAVTALLKQEGVENVLAASDYAIRNGAAFHLAAIAPYVPVKAAGDGRDAFDTNRMRRMYRHGDSLGRSPAPWAAVPPLYVGPEAIEAPLKPTPPARAVTTARP